MNKKKQSLGHDVFNKSRDEDKSTALKKILEGKTYKEAGAKKLEVKVSLTPANIKHLDALKAELEKTGKGRFTRNELIRVAITLLAVGDF